MTKERKNSGISSDGRRRASSRASSTSGQSAKRKTNRRVLKSAPWPARVAGWLGALRREPRAQSSSIEPRERVPSERPASGRPASSRRRVGVYVAGALAAVVLCAIGADLVWSAVTTSATFALETIEVRGASRASEEDIRGLAGVVAGDNAIALDTEEVARLVEKHPWVAAARVLRQLPRGLTIEVEEHVPVALVALDHLYFVDGDGAVVKRLVPGEHEVLPVITGLSRADVERSDAWALGQIKTAIAFIGEWSRRHPAAGGDPSSSRLDEVHVGPRGEIAAGLGEPALRVHLGPAPWDDAITRAEGARAEARTHGFTPAEILAWSERHPERAVVRLAAGDRSGTD